MQNYPIKKTSGMTLVEVVLATFVISVGALAMIQGLYVTKKNADRAQKNLAVLLIAQSYFEQMKAMAANDLMKNDLSFYNMDASVSAFTQNTWTDIPETVLADAIPKGAMQIMPMVVPKETEDGMWFSLSLKYRYLVYPNDQITPDQWPSGILQGMVSKLDNTKNIAPTQVTDLMLDTKQTPFEWPSIISSYSIKPFGDTKPLQPVPSPIAWQPSPPAYTAPPSGPSVPIPQPPPPPINNNSSL